jgi:transaldolase/glucose-6-phosphate isomerase
MSNTASGNPLRLLEAQGQSIWQDNITRGQLQTGSLRALVAADGVSGVTSNPSIFEKAIGGSAEYDDAIRQMVRAGKDTATILDTVMADDIRATADVLRPVWERSGHRDGFVSIEVAANLARDTQNTLSEARRLWKLVGRPNLMVKIPGTAEGVPAVKQCLSEGININITLLFSIAHYEAVAQAFIEAVEARVAAGQPVADLASVASFFVSRVDTIADKAIAAKLQSSTDAATRAKLEGLIGQIAIANAKLAYSRFEELFGKGNARFARLAAAGAQVQRPLWASTSMKDPKRRDTLYVEELIAPHTVNTVPPATIDAFRDHGLVRGATAKEDLDSARRTIQTLQDVGISLNDLTDQLEEEGIKQFKDAFDRLTEETAKKVEELRAEAKQPVG